MARLESAIESKRRLLAYLQSGPKRLTLESYLCLARVLSLAGWHCDGGVWRKDAQGLSLLEAGKREVARQIASDSERLLRLTVRTPRGAENLRPPDS